MVLASHSFQIGQLTQEKHGARADGVIYFFFYLLSEKTSVFLALAVDCFSMPKWSFWMTVVAPLAVCDGKPPGMSFRSFFSFHTPSQSWIQHGMTNLSCRISWIKKLQRDLFGAKKMGFLYPQPVEPSAEKWVVHCGQCDEFANVGPEGEGRSFQDFWHFETPNLGKGSKLE